MSTYDWPQTNLINQSHVSKNSSEVSLTLFFNIEKEYYCKKIVMFTFMDFNALHDEMEDFVNCMVTQKGSKHVFMATKVD